MSHTIIIGFGYKAQHGKDTAVAHLVETFKDQYDIRRYSFGDGLKAEFYDRLMDPLHEHWGDVGHRLGNVSYLALPHPRAVGVVETQASFDYKLNWIAEHKTELGNHLQIYGTDYTRGRDSFYWVRALRRRLEEDKPQIALLSDVRFFTELYFCKAFGGFTVKVSREGFVINDGRSSQHMSETELDGAKFDFEINVLDGEVDELKRDAVTVFEMILDTLKLKPLEGVPSIEVAA